MIARDPSRQPEGDDDREFVGYVDELAAALDAHEALGVDHLILILQPMNEASLDWISEARALRSG